MIEIPSDLHKDLVPLAFLLGTWAGAGVSDFPGADKCNFGQEVTFTHDGRDFLEYHSHTWVLDAEGRKGRPLESESGFWRFAQLSTPPPDPGAREAPSEQESPPSAARQLEVVMVRDDGVVEVWYGELADRKPQIDLATDAIARTAASGPYSGGKRLYGYVKGDLMWVGEKQTPEVPLRPYMSAQLKKVVSPEEVAAWAKDLGDLPDDGIAFFK